jgi:DNA-binding NtrC family response regulator
VPTLNSQPAIMTGRVILLVEDEQSLLTALATFLRLKGVDVLQATSGEEAVEILKNGTAVHLVLSDIEMPGRVNGVELAQWIKINRPSLPVVLTSGRQSADLPGVPFLPKPYRLSALVPIINKCEPGAS